MFCKFCGKELPENLVFCSHCGKSLKEDGQNTPGQISQQAVDAVKARSLDAWEGIKLFAKNPVGGLSASYERFDDKRAIQVGIVFEVIFLIILTITRYILPSRLQSTSRGFLNNVEYFLEIFNISVFNIILIGIVLFVSFTGALAVTQLVFRGKGRFSGNIYTAGAALLPLGLFLLLAVIVGVGNIELIIVLLLFALTYMILILYAGCSRVGNVPETAAAPAVPIIILISAWITKIIVATAW